jgi:hypothetical protein
LQFLQELNESVGGKLSEFIMQINNCYPPEVVEYYSPNYSKTLLQKIDEYAQKNSNIIAWLAFTVTAYNVWHVPEFMWWKLKESGFVKINSTLRRPIITHHVAHGPKRTNIKILPQEVKLELAEFYADWIERFNKEFDEPIAKNAESILNSILKFANAGDISNTLPEFIKFTKYLDQERKQDILSVVPQYSKIFKE